MGYTGPLADKDRIFTNVYGFQEPWLKAAQLRGDWDNTKGLMAAGQDAIVGNGDIGLDAFYNVTPALKLNLSVNTDFAETEVDERRVNLTRFPLFFEEKRDFFLEGSSYFDFGRMPGQAVTPFFSRHIGRDARGRAQRIDVGGKLTGRTGAFDVGVMQALLVATTLMQLTGPLWQQLALKRVAGECNEDSRDAA